MNRLTQALEGPPPLLAAVVTEPLGPAVLGEVTRLADVAELRADKFADSQPAVLQQQLQRLAAMPLLLTIRLQAEGGAWRGDETTRLELFETLLPYADGVDVELAAPILPEVTDLAHQVGKLVVGSYHDFSSTPPLEQLEERLAYSQQVGVDYTKIATSLATPEAYRQLAAFTLTHQADRLITVGMQAYGPLSRLALPGLGSRLTYAYTGRQAAAPGQLSYRDTHEYLKQLYPSYAARFRET